ncbi:MAG: TRAFs-binding domain-containing protein [Xanthobacteraceae bacterium]
MADSQDQKVCFVVMGFGKKTDYETGRTLDLDASYKAIIKPAVKNAGLRCVRADEIIHSGVIDEKMFDMLLKADLVIADLSTSNANALYELGVRHALKPYATILIKEKDGRFHFDLNHIVTMEYQHLGPDVGFQEAEDKRQLLEEKIRSIMKAQETDSPVFKFIDGLEVPRIIKKAVEKRMSTAEFHAAIDEVQSAQNRLTTIIAQAEQAGREDRHREAANGFAAALEITPSDAYLRQQFALHTYKSKQPSEHAALHKALDILAPLDPEKSVDPETLGIAGAIHKRLFTLTGDRAELDKAITFYGRGFEVRRDYYNGENLATCLDMRAAIQDDADEKLFDQMSARKTRLALKSILVPLVESEDVKDRSDRKWVYATAANVAYALGDKKVGEENETRFRKEGLAGWEVDTFEAGKRHALSVAGAKD